MNIQKTYGGIEMSNKLIVFYSRANENYVGGMIKNLTVGNTEIAAGIIKKLTGGDIFKIEQIQEYPENYNECIEKAQDDQRKNARPELRKYPESINDYDVIFLGFPNYWGTMPMAVFTFLEHFDFTGKIIMPFCTHEGSGLGSSVNDIKRICPGAEIEDGLAIMGSKAENAEKAVRMWIEKEESI